MTLPSKPNPPRTIQIICQTRNSLHIKWGPGIDNGSRITSYKLEYAQVLTNSSELGLDKNVSFLCAYSLVFIFLTRLILLLFL
ncbi:unnamed protein product [Schistosoma curassoni]|uniref:Fibronectin type-III domain-containing protein n=1 Tax=Schistosoma curassoni TaxID=6186 RepID=A0A183JR36_9TREM|nr:unnamed protein product [Schistosoma curassoni]